jgi:hypothetical protein
MPASRPSHLDGRYFDVGFDLVYEETYTSYGSPNGDDRSDAYPPDLHYAEVRHSPRPNSHYVNVPRPSRSDYSNLDRVVGDPALERDYFSSHRHAYGRGLSSTQDRNVPVSANMVASPRRTRNSTHNVSNGNLSSGRRGGSQLTRERLAEQQSTSRTETLDRTYGYAGPYDAVGWVRSDGQVFDEDEVYEEYREYDYDIRNEAWR